MFAKISSMGYSMGIASAQLLGNNIEAYENTIPSMLSDRLKNPKFTGPENAQTGVASEWEPIGNNMSGLVCRLVPGMYLSGREAQSVENYTQTRWSGIMQAGIRVREDEHFEVEIWARAQHRPVLVRLELRLPGERWPAEADCSQEILFDQAHWEPRRCVISSPGDSSVAEFRISIPGDSSLVIDQVHLRPIGETHVCRSFEESFAKFPCPVLRFPGGCVSCTYHWEHGTGPVHLRPVCDDPAFKYKVHYDFGTDEYLELCAARNIRPFITLNASTATPDEAHTWAAYVRAWYAHRRLPVPSAYFMIGNENWGIHEIGHMTGEMYAAQLHLFVPGIRTAYPEARIVAIGENQSHGVRDEYKTPWGEVVREKAAGLFDVLAVTRYTMGSDALSLPESMKDLADRLAVKVADLGSKAEAIRLSGLDCTMGVVEWNYWTRASHNDHAGFYEPNDIRHCLFAASYLNAFCRMGEMMEVANYYSLVNTMGMIHVHDGQVALSDVVRVFNLYAAALPGEVLDIDVAAPMLTETSKVTDANFLRCGDLTYGYLLNFCSDDYLDVELNGFGQVIEACSLTAPGILAPVSEADLDVEGNVLSLPPVSLTRVICH